MLFNPLRFAFWMLQSVMHGMLCFWLPWTIYNVTAAEASGQGFELWPTGLVIYTCAASLDCCSRSAVVPPGASFWCAT